MKKVQQNQDKFATEMIICLAGQTYVKFTKKKKKKKKKSGTGSNSLLNFSSYFDC